MADITITATSVAAGSNSDVVSGIAGATITAGQTVYLDATTGRYLLADANSATAAARLPTDIALNGAANGQTVGVLRKGGITIGATVTAGTAYYLSNTAGGICPVADVTGTGTYPTIIGIATSTTALDVLIHASGVSL